MLPASLPVRRNSEPPVAHSGYDLADGGFANGMEMACGGI